MTRKSGISLRIKNNKSWNSCWYSRKLEYNSLLQEDVCLYIFIRSQIIDLFFGKIFTVKLCRLNKYLIIHLLMNNRKIFDRQVAKYFLSMLYDINKFFQKTTFLSISTLHDKINSLNLALTIGKLIEKRIKFRSRTIKLLLKEFKKVCNGVHIQCKGRINNVDMARVDSMYLGSVPFQSIKFMIDYSFIVSNTIKGLQSIKVWICR
uniref:ribosomal protein S3 n=1 Tax=Cryptomonas gyropyrenoidosa TaxID=233257 RepID=UPI0027A14C5D|nr:ribosomal protein S3 [Cryptomonas gyropyrenoidosa]WFQ82684.1 ribosomal protein S3 [Cryptomonas gyropyrenoidosa]